MNTKNQIYQSLNLQRKRNPTLHITKRTGQNVKGAKNIISHSLRTSLLL